MGPRRRTRVTATVTGVALLTAGLLQGSTAHAGPPPRPGAVTTGDIDGDARPDRITLTRAGRGHTRVTVATASGVTATKRVRAIAGTALRNRLEGLAPVDGVSGREIVIDTGFGDCLHSVVLTWRDGALVRLPAPGRFAWMLCSPDPTPVGYGFRRTTARGATLTGIQGFPDGDQVAVRWVRFRWTTGGWHRVGIRWDTITQAAATKLWQYRFRWDR